MTQTNAPRSTLRPPQFSGLISMKPSAIDELRQRALAFHKQQATSEDGGEGNSLASYTRVGSTALIDLCGTVTKYPSWVDYYFGFTPTENLRLALGVAMQDALVDRVCWRIDSPGGYAAGVGELATAIAAADQIKPQFAVISDQCCSAAFWIASQCRQIVMGPDGWAGCIGVFTVLLDDSAQDEMLGLNWTLVSSGGVKGLGTDGRVTEPLIAEVRREISCTYENFIAAVSRGRGMSIDAARALGDGRSWMGNEAKEKGLVDFIYPGTAEAIDVIARRPLTQTRDTQMSTQTQQASEGPIDREAAAAVAESEWNAMGAAEKTRWIKKGYVSYRIGELMRGGTTSPAASQALSSPASAGSITMNEDEAKAQAATEWQQMAASDRSAWVNETAYIGYRAGELRGFVKTSRRAG